MTAKASSVKFHPSLNFYRYSARRTMGLTVLMTVFMLLFCPGYVLMHINNRLSSLSSGIFNFDNIAPTVILAVTAITCGAALLYLFVNFSFLYSRSGSDFFHSLPFKRTGLLASRFFASLVPILLPMALTYAAMCGILALDYIEGSIRLILTGFAYNILILIMCAAFTMLFIVCAGSVFDLIISFATFNIGVIIIELINSTLCQEYLWGYPWDAEYKLLLFSSPFYYAFVGLFGLLDGNTVYADSYAVFALKLVTITLLSLVAAFLLYRRRKSERSGDSYAYKFIYTVCAIIVGIVGAYLVGVLFSDGNINLIFWIFTVVGGLLAAVTFGAINDRGFKTVKKSLIIGGVSVVCLALTALTLWSGFFGYSTRIPSAERVKSATVSFSGCEVEFTNPDLVFKLHGAIAENGAETDEYQYISVSYSLKNGDSFKRAFYVDYNDYIDALLEIYRSDENKASIEKQFNSFTENNLAISLYSDENTVNGLYLTPAELTRLKEAYLKDISSATANSITGELYCTLDISGFDKDFEYLRESFYVEEGFKNTLEVINSLDLEARAKSVDNEG